MKLLIAAVLMTTLLCACSSNPPIHQEAYAKLSNHRTFENEFLVVWKATGEALRNYKVNDRDPDLSATPQDLAHITQGKIVTDWVYAQSRDKYVVYNVNGSPRRQLLQTRVKYTILEDRRIGGTDVTVNTKEEIEKLKSDGTPDGYDSIDEVDPSRANEILDKIKLAILAAPNTSQAP